MAEPLYPFTSFNFAIEIRVEGGPTKVCNAAFSECDGLEMTAEIKTIREGGSNDRQIRLSGPVTYGTVTLKRGLTSSFDLWSWFQLTLEKPATRASAEIIIFAADGKTERVRYVLSRCIPIKLKAPPLNAKDGLIAVEEFQMAYEHLQLKPA